MIRTLKYAVRHSPENAQAIGYQATQQNLAYNQAVDILNREPQLPKRSSPNCPNALSKRITAWRQENRSITQAPYHIHQLGAEQAWQANHLLQISRSELLARIQQAQAAGKPLKKRDTRQRRRTLQLRKRKTSRLRLAINDRRLFQVSTDGRTVSSKQCGFILNLRGRQNLSGLDIRSIRLVPIRSYSARTPLSQRRYYLQVQVYETDPPAIETVKITNAEEITGTDLGRKNHIMFSNGDRAHHPGSKKRSSQRRKHQRQIAGKPRRSKHRQHAVTQHRKRTQRFRQHRTQEIRRQIREVLETEQPKILAVESLLPKNMIASARGTAASPGKNVAAKQGLNRSLAEASLGLTSDLLQQEAAKLKIPIMKVPAAGSSQSCPSCGHRHRNNRESQAVFRCRRCNFQANADWTASVIIRNRAYYRLCERRPKLQSRLKDAPPTGWPQQPSDGYRQLILPIPVKRVQSERRRDELPKAAGSVAPGRRAVAQRPSQTPQMLAYHLVNTLLSDPPGPLQRRDNRNLRQTDTPARAGCHLRQPAGTYRCNTAP